MCDYDDLLNPLNPLSPINPIYKDLLYGDDTDSKEDNNQQNQDEENIRQTHQESKISHEITEVYVSEFDLFGDYKKEENNNIDYPDELNDDPPF